MQSIVNLPETAEITLKRGYNLKIKNHEVQDIWSFFNWILIMIKDGNSEEILTQMKSQKIQHEAVVEYCATEVESDLFEHSLAIWSHCDVWKYHHYSEEDMLENRFKKSTTAMNIVKEFEYKIRNSEDLDDLFRVMNPDSIFIKKTRGKIKRWIHACEK